MLTATAPLAWSWPLVTVATWPWLAAIVAVFPPEPVEVGVGAGTGVGEEAQLLEVLPLPQALTQTVMPAKSAEIEAALNSRRETNRVVRCSAMAAYSS